MSAQSPKYAIPLHLGTDTNKSIAFKAEEELLKTHMAIFGGTRYGKSKLFELICRQLLQNGRGFAFIDPHSDTADDLLSYLACHAKELSFVCKKVHYLKPGDQLFSFDPFRYRPDPDDLDTQTDFGYRTWLNTKIKDMVKIIVRQQGETEDDAQKMVRLRRWMYNALYAVGVRQDAEGTHLPLSDAFILLNPQHAGHNELYGRVEKLLPKDTVRADFEKLRNTRDPRKQEEWVESTFNRLRDILSPLVQRIFNLEAPSIDFYDIIQRNGVILASLGKTTQFHQDEALAIAGLLIREITEAVRTVQRSKRKQFYLFMDEAQNFLGEDMIQLLKESAKYKLSVGLAVQALDNLQKGQLDLVPSVLGQCGLRITFRQQYHEHAEVLAKCLCYPLLDFTELLHEVDRDDGYDFILMPSESVGSGTTKSVSYGRTKSHSTGTTHGRSVTRSTQDSKSDGTSQSESEGTSSQWSTSHGETDTKGQSTGTSWQNTQGQSQDHSKTEGTSESYTSHPNQSSGTRSSGTFRSSSIRHGTSASRSVGGSETENESHGVSNQSGQGGGESHATTEGKSVTKGKSSGSAVSNSQSRSESSGEGESTTKGEAHSQNNSITLTLTPLHKTRSEFQQTGNLEHSIPDQIGIHTHAIQSLDKQHCLVAVAAFNSAFVLRVGDVFDPFEQRFVSAEWRQDAIQRLKEAIFSNHPFYFSASSVSTPVEPVSQDPELSNSTPPIDPFLPKE